ncbi:MAG: hypothetical protein HYS12_18275 [Planctomycetes bacterium]|nr:hypothetical protein [Planctomycetota bacterium]
MLVKISCAHCKGALILNEDHVGRLVRCPKCKNTFTAKPPEPEDAEPAQPVLDVIDLEPIPEAETTPVELQREPNPAPGPRPVALPGVAPLRRPVSRRRSAPRFHFPVRVLDDSSGELLRLALRGYRRPPDRDRDRERTDTVGTPPLAPKPFCPVDAAHWHHTLTRTGMVSLAVLGGFVAVTVRR